MPAFLHKLFYYTGNMPEVKRNFLFFEKMLVMP